MGIPVAHPLPVSLLNKVSEVQARRRPTTWQARKQRVTARKDGRHIVRRPRSILIKRRTRLEGSRRAAGNGRIDRRVRALKMLIPRSTGSMGLDGLFRDTADYILALQMRVKVMQTMVKVLTGAHEE